MTDIYKKNKDMENMFSKFNLKSNPFRMTPANPDELVWAGFPEVKAKLERRIKHSILIPNSTLVLNWGEYGSGKTHAAKFFSKQNILQGLSGDNKIPLSFVVNMPKSKEPIKEIYTRIVDKLDILMLRQKIVESGLDVSETVKEITDNLLIQNVIIAMFKGNDTLFPNEDDFQNFKAYLYGTSDLKQYNKSGILRKFTNDGNDYVEFLAALFSLLTYKKKIFSCVNLWIDEFEEISLLTTSSISGVNSFIRTLMDKAPNNLLVFLNLTQSAMMNVEDLSEYLHESVKSRIKERVELRIPSLYELKEYLRELLAFHRLSESKEGYSPFEESLICELSKDLGNVSLRRFNEAFSCLLENAAVDEISIISVEYYNSIKSEIIGWK